MKTEFKDWLYGVALFILITFGMYELNKWVLPNSHYTMLEWFGLIMAVVVIKTGMDSWNKDE
jgi:hypothetical protein